MAQPSDRLYARTHEWVKVEGDEATVGLSQFAQEQLGDLVFVELPAIGTKVTQGQVVANVESVKAVSEIFAPVAGEVIAVNGELEGHPERINHDPFGEGWMLKLRVSGAPAGLMDAAAYDRFIAEEGGH